MPFGVVSGWALQMWTCNGHSPRHPLSMSFLFLMFLTMWPWGSASSPCPGNPTTQFWPVVFTPTLAFMKSKCKSVSSISAAIPVLLSNAVLPVHSVFMGNKHGQWHLKAYLMEKRCLNLHLLEILNFIHLLDVDLTLGHRSLKFSAIMPQQTVRHNLMKHPSELLNPIL